MRNGGDKPLRRQGCVQVKARSRTCMCRPIQTASHATSAAYPHRRVGHVQRWLRRTRLLCEVLRHDRYAARSSQCAGVQGELDRSGFGLRCIDFEPFERVPGSTVASEPRVVCCCAGARNGSTASWVTAQSPPRASIVSDQCLRLPCDKMLHKVRVQMLSDLRMCERRKNARCSVHASRACYAQ